ncbi:bifunctional (p)ppGpp synthetase/guanosine-3',5'-bis(diphosphate) 3'-pyrophosphohydrolase [Rothia sp. ZJ1223]|uniref:RelA/SpoT family protein n=1 Tax=Rothia sp. ZJ1223 TaxID=2811098 RepID=UPI001958B101|nr:bifunctional (p)ppGpp synthetase/guanosine-3',5'-bis(diphosphate) 3'-pyrophosphohydrolase [Rothia sp. ZJ1223]MBM7050479.1 bifunctional (p)ppGpp synthetase/guanosine-3',5'-bis(diphosphate) 3'-pyrophosphohydrolase [Rothia sp. ZJ1223]
MSAGERVPTRLVFPRVNPQNASARHYSPVLAPVIRTVKKYHPNEDLDVIQRAFEVADKYHRGQKRKSGDPYITHPVAVTTILAELGATGPLLVAGLLHDTVEDTEYTKEQLTADFGEEIALLVNGVTKLDKVDYGVNAPIETIRKLIIAMTQDVRVLLIKLADRLHNARTWRFVSPGSAAKKAEETLKFYAPLAHRLGLNTIKWELEDLSFAAMSPDVYAELVEMVGERTPQMEKHLADARITIANRLTDTGIEAQVTGRPKHFYSIHQKMVTQNKNFDDINDILAVRILVEDEDACYSALGQAMSIWPIVPGRFKDYIRTPKNNHYQSLHITLIGPGGFPLEVQIRTYKMHEEAEYGLAAHWRYKAASRGESLEAKKEPDAHTQSINIGILQSIAEISSSNPDSEKFYEMLADTLDTDEIVVLTPQGKPIALPAGSTPVDFAYAVHTEVGEKTVSAHVNGKMVPLHAQLVSGSTVEITTSKSPTAEPSEDWLKFVKSSRARTKIRQYFAKGRRLEAIDKGKEQLTKAMRHHELPLQKMMTQSLMTQVAHKLNKNDMATLYHSVGEGTVSTQDVIDHLVSLYYGHQGTPEPEVDEFDEVMFGSPTTLENSNNGVMVAGADSVMTRIARCCSPIPPDEIVGVVTKMQGISVHCKDCTNVASEESAARSVEVKWAPNSNTTYQVRLQIEALDRRGLIADITKVFAEQRVNVVDMRTATTRDRVAISTYQLDISDRFMVEHLINVLLNVKGVYSAYRLTGTRPEYVHA